MNLDELKSEYSFENQKKEDPERIPIKKIIKIINIIKFRFEI